MDKQILDRIMELEMEIATWGSYNSQSNPGAVMDLRDKKRELEKLKKNVGLNSSK